jgi:hypothetical protein
MIILEVSLNGSILNRVGAEDLTHASIMASVRGRLGSLSDTADEPRAIVEAFGKTINGENVGDVRKWKSSPLRLGDELRIRLIESPIGDIHTDAQRLAMLGHHENTRQRRVTFSSYNSYRNNFGV